MKADRKIGLAWAAGLFEGEGSFLLERGPHGKRRFYLRMSMCSTDFDVLEKFLAVVGIGSISGPYEKGPNCKPQWKWRAAGQPVLDLVADPAFVQHLCTRRTQRLNELRVVALAQEEVWPAKTHCPKGHQYTETNTYRWKRYSSGEGYRCRECHRLREAARRRQKAATKV